MRFSIVFDDNGTILAASVGDEEANNAVRSPGVSSGCFDISDDLPDAELHQTVERLLIETDARELKQRRSQEEADIGQSGVDLEFSDKQQST
jgi:hypothetical protein